MSKGTIKNEHDQGAKIVFENPEMCAQFLAGYIPIDCLKGLKAEQIEDMSERFVTMVMKLLRYMVMIWNDYEKETETKQPGIIKTREFKYPPILPIVYFEGSGAWTAAKQFSERIALADVFEEYQNSCWN